MTLSRTARLVGFVILTLGNWTVAEPVPQDISVAQLLASPAKFDGCRVSVRGYYYADVETSCLYATADGPKRRRGIENTIWIEFRGTPDVASIVGRQVRLVGTVHYNPRAGNGTMHGYGSMGLWSAALLDTVIPIPKRG